jgi:hypothetical protein
MMPTAAGGNPGFVHNPAFYGECFVITGLDPVIHVLLSSELAESWMAGHRQPEATPSFGRLCPAMTN